MSFCSWEFFPRKKLQDWISCTKNWKVVDFFKRSRNCICFCSTLGYRVTHIARNCFLITNPDQGLYQTRWKHVNIVCLNYEKQISCMHPKILGIVGEIEKR